MWHGHGVKTEVVLPVDLLWLGKLVLILWTVASYEFNSINFLGTSY